MAAQQDPHVSAQNVGSTNTMFETEIRFDSSYITTRPGIIKGIVIVLNLIGFICIQASAFASNGRGVYFSLVSQLAFWFSAILLVLYLFHLVEKYHNIKWLQIEMFGYGIIAVNYLIASTIAVAFGAPAYSAAGFFGYINMVLYGYDAFLKMQALNAGELAQGRRVVTQQTPAPSPVVP